MQQTEDIGCLTQRSQLDRLQELADGITRERVKTLQSSDLLVTTVLVIGPSGKESTWDLDHLPMARSATEPAVQLLLDPEAALDNLVPTQAIMRILRDTAASAVALIAPVSGSAAGLQLADIDHEQSLTARIDRQPKPLSRLVRRPLARWLGRCDYATCSARQGAVASMNRLSRVRPGRSRRLAQYGLAIRPPRAAPTGARCESNCTTPQAQRPPGCSSPHPTLPQRGREFYSLPQEGREFDLGEDLLAAARRGDGNAART